MVRPNYLSAPPLKKSSASSSLITRGTKRKAPEGNPSLPPPVIKKISPGVGRGRGKTTLPPITAPQASSSKTPSSGPSSQSEAGILWSRGLTPALSKALQPPSHYFTSPLTEEQVKEVELAREWALKAASLLQTLPVLHEEYAVSRNELAAVEQQRDEALGRETLAADAKAEAEANVDALQKSNDGLHQQVAELRRELEMTRVQEARHKQTIGSLQALCDKAEVDLERTQLELAEAESSLSNWMNAAVESFDNALAQVQVLNPGVALDISKAHWQAYVEDGVFFGPPEDQTSATPVGTPVAETAAETPAEPPSTEITVEPSAAADPIVEPREE